MYFAEMLQELFSLCFSADLLGLLYNLLASSVTVQQQMSQNKGFLVIGHLLEKVIFSIFQVNFEEILNLSHVNP